MDSHLRGNDSVGTFFKGLQEGGQPILSFCEILTRKGAIKEFDRTPETLRRYNHEGSGAGSDQTP